MEAEEILPRVSFIIIPLIKFLGEDNCRDKPAYINKQCFSKVIVDLLRGDQVKPGDNINPLIQKALDEKTTNWGKSKNQR